MSFALTRFSAYGLEIGTTSRKRGRQVIEMRITGSAADVDLDISDDDGTFWTDALADTTHGDLADKAHDFLFGSPGLAATVRGLIAIGSQKLLDRVRVASLSGAGEYTVDSTGVLPDIAFNAADGETSIDLVLEFQTKDEQPVQVLELGHD